MWRQQLGSGPAYDADDYRSTATASLLELQEQPGRVIDRLIGKLLRGLGTEDYYRGHVHYSTPDFAGID